MSPLWLMQIPQPDPVPQPAPSWLLWCLLLVTFVLHLLPMNFVLGGSLIAALARVRGQAPGREHARRLSRWIGKAMPVAVAAAITFGVAPLLFLQVIYGRLFFTSSVLMAGFWLAVVPLLIVGYYGAYLVSMKGVSRWGTSLIVVWLLVIVFLTIAFVYVNNMSLMLNPNRFVELYRADGRGLQLNLADPSLVPRYLHMVLGALAVAGLAIVAHGAWVRARDEAFGTWAMRHGASWCAGATAINMIVGFWWLLVLPRPTLIEFMSRVPAIALFAGVTAGFITLSLAVLAARATDPAPAARWTIAGLLVTVVLMVVSRDQLRTVSLAAAGFEPTTWVAPQWGAIGVFVALLGVAAATVVWMVMALSRPRPR